MYCVQLTSFYKTAPTSQSYRTAKPLLPTPVLSLPLKYLIFVREKPVKRMSSAEMNEKRAKGFRFWRDKNYELGHKCKKQQFYRLEVCGDFEDGVYEEGVELEGKRRGGR